MKEHIIKAGSHASKPYCFSWSKVGQEDFEVEFDESALYIIDGPDQMDFCKGPGRSMHLFTNHKNSYMLGWRHNPQAGAIELTSYYHINGQRIMGPNGVNVLSYPEMPFKVGGETTFPSGIGALSFGVQSWEIDRYLNQVDQYWAAIGSVEILASVQPGERWLLSLRKNHASREYGIAIFTEDGGWVSDIKQFSIRQKRQRYINWYFGGNQSAPNDILIRDQKI